MQIEDDSLDDRMDEIEVSNNQGNYKNEKYNE